MATAIQKIDDRLRDLDPDSLRYRVLVALRTFRASWIELGRLLTETVFGGDYKEYGYDDFEVYCARELGLKKPTVHKLMVSYNYMKKFEAGRLAAIEDGAADATGVAPPPDYQTVALLDKVRRHSDEMDEDGGAVRDDEVEALHARVFSSGADDEVELRKELRLRLRPAATAEAMDRGTGERRRRLAAILRLARELRRQLSAAGSAVPGGLRDRLEQGLTELEALD